MQLLCIVQISNFTTEVLFHVLPDIYLRSDILTGRCFASKEFRDFCESKNIKLHLIATGSSRANGQVERMMSVIKSMLTAVETTNDKSWQDSLGDVQLALNCTVNRVTKASPLELLIGKVARPLDLMADDCDDSIDLDEVRRQASDGILESARYDKERFDKTVAVRNGPPYVESLWFNATYLVWILCGCHGDVFLVILTLG